MQFRWFIHNLLWMACALGVLWLMGLARAVDPPATAPSGGLHLLLSADDEGHTAPCAHCPAAYARGGLARRSTAIENARRDQPLLLLDAGNALFGGDGGPTGQVLVAAFNALRYDVLNVSYREFRFGKQATLQAMEEACFSPISSNLLDEGTGNLLFAPYAIKHLNGQTVAIVGITEPPAGLEQLPHLRAQLAGIRIRPISEALEQWLPAARAGADRVILLFYGSLDGAVAVRRTFGAKLDAIGLGGVRPRDLDAACADPGPPLLAADGLGKSLADARLDGSGGWTILQVTIDPSLPDDPHIQQLLRRYEKSPQGQ